MSSKELACVLGQDFLADTTKCFLGNNNKIIQSQFDQNVFLYGFRKEQLQRLECKEFFFKTRKAILDLADIYRCGNMINVHNFGATLLISYDGDVLLRPIPQSKRNSILRWGRDYSTILDTRNEEWLLGKKRPKRFDVEELPKNVIKIAF
tara:strand:+ start:1363 stop:1812 length:450 start_codon:yes stop_codon:yes gene_type:complete